MSRTRSLLALALAGPLALTACGSSDGAVASGPVTAAATGDCPAPVLDVVVSVGQWGDLVRQLGGPCATVTTIISSAAVDPHDYEPTPGDAALFDRADLVVVNGADYDHWAEDAVASASSDPAVVDAAGVAGVAAGGNPHLWYSPVLVPQVLDAVTAELQRLAPDASEVFDAQRAALADELGGYDDAVTATASAASGKTCAATEGVFDDMAAAVGLTDVTPTGYRDAASNGSDPAPGDVADFEAALADGSVDVLVYNTQTEGAVPEQLRAAAEAAGVPVVEVTESVPEGQPDFVGWQVAQLTALTRALAG